MNREQLERDIALRREMIEEARSPEEIADADAFVNAQRQFKDSHPELSPVQWAQLCEIDDAQRHGSHLGYVDRWESILAEMNGFEHPQASAFDVFTGSGMSLSGGEVIHDLSAEDLERAIAAVRFARTGSFVQHERAENYGGIVTATDIQNMAAARASSRIASAE